MIFSVSPYEEFKRFLLVAFCTGSFFYVGILLGLHVVVVLILTLIVIIFSFG